MDDRRPGESLAEYNARMESERAASDQHDQAVKDAAKAATGKSHDDPADRMPIDDEIDAQRAKITAAEKRFFVKDAEGKSQPNMGAVSQRDVAQDTLKDLEEAKLMAGCTPTMLIVAVVVLLVGIAGVAVLTRTGGDDKKQAVAGTEGPTPSSCANGENGARRDGITFIACDAPAGLDGHWVLVSGLKDPYKDMPLSCSNICDQPGYTLNIDDPVATIDISGTNITGGTYKTGFTSSKGGDPCTGMVSKIDATVSGGVDLTQNYGQLIVDGHATVIAGCDQNNTPIQHPPDPSIDHTAHYFYVTGDTLFMCYVINTTTFQSCDDPAGGAGATFKRG
jgi:hypothetical protein